MKIIGRITESYTFSFIKYLLGLREALTSVTPAEHKLLSILAKDKNCIIEVGVKDGAIAFHDSQICDARPDLDEQTGPVRLIREIIEGRYGKWKIVGVADSLTAIAK